MIGGALPPGGDVIAKMLAGGPALLLLDEVLKYLERVLAEPVGDSTLRAADAGLHTVAFGGSRPHVERCPGL